MLAGGDAVAFSPRHDMTREDLPRSGVELRLWTWGWMRWTEIFQRDAATPEAFVALREEGEPESSAGYPDRAQYCRAVVLDAAIKEITVGALHFMARSVVARLDAGLFDQPSGAAWRWRGG